MYTTRYVALTSHEATVASAAPATPHPKANMNSGSSTKFATAEMMVPIIDALAAPSARTS